MTFRVAVLIFLLAFGSAPLLFADGGEPDEVPQTLTVDLAPVDIPLSAIKSISTGGYVRSVPGNRGCPEGYDTLFVGRVGARRSRLGLETGGMPVRFLHKGFDRSTLSLYLWRDGEDPVELPRLEETIHRYYIAFGPFKNEGLPKCTVHFYFPLRNVDAWKARPTKIVYVTAMECLAGTLELDGKKHHVGLFDRNFNRKFTDFCRSHRQEGDWLLWDANNDGRFEIHPSGAEVRGITKVMRLGNYWWTVAQRERTLVLTRAEVETFRLRVKGFAGPCVISGWSYLTGDIKAALDAEGCLSIPKASYRLYSYTHTRGDWRIVGSLGVTGVRDAPQSGEAEVSVGPAFRGELTKYSRGGKESFRFRVLGSAGEAVSVYYKGRRGKPVFVVTDQDGNEVIRRACAFG